MESQKVRTKPGPKPKPNKDLERITELENKQLQLISERQQLINEHSKKVKELEDYIQNLNEKYIQLEKSKNNDPMLTYQIVRGWGEIPQPFTIRRY